MMYADRYPIQFRQNVVSGEIQMRVDDWDSPMRMPLNLN